MTNRCPACYSKSDGNIYLCDWCLDRFINRVGKLYLRDFGNEKVVDTMKK